MLPGTGRKCGAYLRCSLGCVTEKAASGTNFMGLYVVRTSGCHHVKVQSSNNDTRRHLGYILFTLYWNYTLEWVIGTRVGLVRALRFIRWFDYCSIVHGFHSTPERYILRINLV